MAFLQAKLFFRKRELFVKRLITAKRVHSVQLHMISHMLPIEPKAFAQVRNHEVQNIHNRPLHYKCHVGTRGARGVLTAKYLDGGAAIWLVNTRCCLRQFMQINIL